MKSLPDESLESDSSRLSRLKVITVTFTESYLHPPSMQIYCRLGGHGGADGNGQGDVR